MKKLLSVLLLSFLLTSCFGNNSEGNKDDSLSKSSSKMKGDIKIPKFDKDLKQVSLVELNNSLYSNGGDKLKEKIKDLSSEENSFDNKMKAVFLESFIGDYDTALKSRKELCKGANTLKSICKSTEANFSIEDVIDNEGNGVKDITFEINGKKIVKFQNNTKLNNNFVNRIKISKEGYLDFYKKIYINPDLPIKNHEISPKLIKADITDSMDTKEEKQINTTDFNFSVGGNFIDHSGKKYNGKVKVYGFNLGESDNDNNVFNLDAFTQDGSYAGNSMVTFGMPLLKFYDTSGNELHIKEGYTGKGKLQNTEKAVGMDLKNVPKNVYLDREELAKYNIPPFWNLDIKSGVWYESKMKILDEEGNYEFMYNTF